MTQKKQAVQNYLFSERAKNNLISVSKMLALAGELKGAERTGAKKIIVVFLESIQSELEHGSALTGETEFQKASGILDNVKNFLEFDDFEQAAPEIGKAITECTTPAQKSWQVLSENEII